MRKALALLIAAAVAATVAPACGRSRVAGEAGLSVFAAASLTAPFTEIAAAFSDAPASGGTKVTLNFASSATLVAQIRNGAPADVVATADTVTMQRLADAHGLRGAPVPFATNELAIVVGKGNPKGITGLADLAKPDVVYVAASPEVPIGAYASRALATAKVAARPRSLEPDVKALVNKVVLGEADAAIVYATDVAAAGPRGAGVAIAPEHNVTASYPIAVTSEAKRQAAASAFVQYVTSSAGTAILAKHGFGPS